MLCLARRSTVNAEVNDLFERAVAIAGAVGVQLSIIRGDSQIDFVSGLANSNSGIPLTHDTVIQIGSVTKVFNAAMIMSLVERGSLQLDIPVQSYIPEFQVSDQFATRTITLRHLLSMSAGLDNGDYGDYGTGEDAIRKRVAALGALPQHFAPGSHFGYSNAGTDISGHVAERVTGKIWDDLINECVLQPLGLTNAASLARDRVFQRVSVGHQVDSETGRIHVIRPWDGISRGLAPAGSTLTISAHDLARFGKMFLRGGLAESGVRVLSEQSIKTMMTPQVEVPVHCHATAWCIGPLLTKWGDAKVWGHAGGNASGGSFMCWIPEVDGVLAFTFNTPSLAVHARLFMIMTRDVLKAVFGIANTGAKVPELATRTDFRRYIGTYQSLAGQCIVDTREGKLAMTTNCEFSSRYRYTDFCYLVPAGRDRFLLDKENQNDRFAFPHDVAFFGNDSSGRASNLTCMLFPFSRMQA